MNRFQKYWAGKKIRILYTFQSFTLVTFYDLDLHKPSIYVGFNNHWNSRIISFTSDFYGPIFMNAAHNEQVNRLKGWIPDNSGYLTRNSCHGMWLYIIHYQTEKLFLFSNANLTAYRTLCHKLWLYITFCLTLC